MTDYSAGGARLMLAEPRVLPNRFYISFDGFAGVLYCELRHASESEVGLEFCSMKGRRAVNQRQIAELLSWLTPPSLGSSTSTTANAVASIGDRPVI